jgi:hypothetical protein
MISSASNCIELGTSMPSAFAVFRLMTSSNYCITGRSLGFFALEGPASLELSLACDWRLKGLRADCLVHLAWRLFCPIGTVT